MNKRKVNLQQFATQTIGDFVNAPALAAYWTTKTTEQAPFLGDVLFPSNKQLGMELSFLKGKKGAPIALRPSAFDAQAIPRDRQGFEKLVTDMIFFRESKYIDEKQRQELNLYMQTNNQAYIDAVLGHVYDDATELVTAASVAREAMRMELLNTGKITVKGNGQDHLIDYGFNEEHKGKATVSWSDGATADPIEDIRLAMEKIEEDTGEAPARALLNLKTFQQLRKNANINKSISVFGNGTLTLSNQMILDFLMEHLGIEVVVYNKRYNDGATTKKYVDDNKFILLPAGNLGTTWFGTTPEESDLMASTAAEVNIVDTGVAITTSQKVNPVNVETIVSQISLPSFEAMDNIFILDTIQGA